LVVFPLWAKPRQLVKAHKLGRLAQTSQIFWVSKGQPQQAASLPVVQYQVRHSDNCFKLVVQLLVQWEGLVAVQPLALQWRLVLPI
jgi:hypothetical protein